MGFPLKDVRYSTRRSKNEDASDAGDGATVAETRALYPRLLRDRSVLPKVDIAIQYFESLVGRERREMDAEVLVQFFGDHKLARCVVAALASSYRYRNPDFREVCSRTAMQRLERAGVAAPRSLRALLYAALNGEGGAGDGFMRRDEQAGTYGRMEKRFALRSGQAERLLYLDAAEHALLTRSGPPPRSVDVTAQYNFGILETLLRHASAVELTLTDNAGGGHLARTVAALPALGAEHEVDLRPAPAGRGLVQLRIAGRADALGSWSRHGRRVARAVVQLLERSRRVVAEGTAQVVLRERRATLRLTPEVLDLLSLGTGSAPDAGWDDLPGWDGASLAGNLAANRGALSRRPSVAEGPSARLGLRRLPEPQAWAAGVLLPDLRLVRGSLALRVCVARSVAHGERLAAIAPGALSGEPVLYCGSPTAVAPLLAAGSPAVVMPALDLVALVDAAEGLQLEPPVSAPRGPRPGRASAASDPGRGRNGFPRDGGEWD